MGLNCFMKDTKKYVEVNVMEPIQIENQLKAEKILETEQPKGMFIEIPNWNWKRAVRIGTVDHIYSKYATLLTETKNNIVIAGHDIDIVFHELQKIKVGEEVVFIVDGEEIMYQVTEVKKVWPYQIEYLKETEESQLTLITCTENDAKRLIVICKKINFDVS